MAEPGIWRRAFSLARWTRLGAVGLALVAQPARAGDDAAVEREWRVRAWALQPAAQIDALSAACESQDWPERAAAFDALARAALGGAGLSPALRARIEAGVEDAHPNVRALALRALGGLGSGGRLRADAARSLAADELPLVRLELARALALLATPAGGELLEVLAQDADPSVARAARASLCVRPQADWREIQRLMLALHARGTEEELLELAEILVSLAPDQMLFESLREQLGGSDRRTRALRALIEALSFRCHGLGDARALIDGWLAGAGWSGRRQALLVSSARSADRELGEALLEILLLVDDLCEAGPGEHAGARFAGLFSDLEALRAQQGSDVFARLTVELAEAALDGLGAQETIAWLARREPGAFLVTQLLGALSSRAPRWEPEVAVRWIDPARAFELRWSAVEAFAASLSRRSEPGAGMLLAAALGDPDPRIRRRAFRALCDAQPLEPWLELLHVSWITLDAREGLERLAELPRAHALLPFRDDLLALGEHADRRRSVAAELLAGARGDQRVHARLESWLEEDLARFADSPDEPMRRALELRVQGELRCLARVAPVAAVAALARALDRANGASVEIGKTAARALGRSREGRQELLGRLDGLVDLTTRIEAAIALGADEPRALEHLIRDYRLASWELRSRMIDALGQAGDARARAFLEALLFELGRDDERRAALLALARRDEPEARADIERAAREAHSLETRRAAIRFLGRPGAEHARSLVSLLDGLAEERLNEEEAALLRGEILAATGATGDFPVHLEADWLRAAHEQRVADLKARFRGEELPAIEFRWRGELELAGHLARAHRIDSALRASVDWPQLDGRLLLALSERSVREARCSAGLRLARAALNALSGEHERDAKSLAAARCSILACAWETRRWEIVARLAQQLFVEHRTRRLPDSVWIGAFGVLEPEAGVDPGGRLQSVQHQALARSALEGGDLQEARAAARAAARSLGASKRAAQEQRLLEQDLESAGRR